jgi:TetR/AcrR family transcriptional repressor of nem operon
MGRPREFAEGEVLDRALQTFWARGYEATSVQDLVEATGLSRASLYGAFGDKDALFSRVLGHYRAMVARAFEELEQAPSARAGLEKFLLSNLDAACPVEGPRGCFLQLAANECQPARPEVAAAAVEAARSTEQALLKALRRGKKSGELAASLDEKGLARLLAVTVQGMAASARAGRTREELREVVKQAVRLLQ